MRRPSARPVVPLAALPPRTGSGDSDSNARFVPGVRGRPGPWARGEDARCRPLPASLSRGLPEQSMTPVYPGEHHTHHHPFGKGTPGAEDRRPRPAPGHQRHSRTDHARPAHHPALTDGSPCPRHRPWGPQDASDSGDGTDRFPRTPEGLPSPTTRELACLRSALQLSGPRFSSLVNASPPEGPQPP